MKKIKVNVYSVVHSSYSTGDNELFTKVVLTTTDKDKARECFENIVKSELSEDGNMQNPSKFEKDETHCYMADGELWDNSSVKSKECTVEISAHTIDVEIPE